MNSDADGYRTLMEFAIDGSIDHVIEHLLRLHGREVNRGVKQAATKLKSKLHDTLRKEADPTLRAMLTAPRRRRMDDVASHRTSKHLHSDAEIAS